MLRLKFKYKILLVIFFLVLITSLWPKNIYLLVLFSFLTYVILPIKKCWDRTALVLLLFSLFYISFKSLRENVAIVSQETYLFRGSIMDNIRYANPEASREQVLAAARAAGCHDFIMAMPDGRQITLFAEQGTKAELLYDSTALRYKITKGGPLQMLHDSISQEIDTRRDNRRKIETLEKFIEKHPVNEVNIELLRRYAIDIPDPDYTKIKNLISILMKRNIL